MLFRLVKRWVAERRSGRLRRFQRDDRGPPFVPGKCWTPVELRGESVVDWKCVQGDRSNAVTLLASPKCNEVHS